MEIYPRRTSANTFLFLEKMVEETHFSVQSVQTDRGRKFFAYKVQEWLKEYCIKFLPIRSGQPHLNGKVERAQQTDLKEFWALIDLKGQEPALVQAFLPEMPIESLYQGIICRLTRTYEIQFNTIQIRPLVQYL